MPVLRRYLVNFGAAAGFTKIENLADIQLAITTDLRPIRGAGGMHRATCP